MSIILIRNWRPMTHSYKYHCSQTFYPSLLLLSLIFVASVVDIKGVELQKGSLRNILGVEHGTRPIVVANGTNCAWCPKNVVQLSYSRLIPQGGKLVIPISLSYHPLNTFDIIIQVLIHLSTKFSLLLDYPSSIGFLVNGVKVSKTS